MIRGIHGGAGRFEVSVFAGVAVVEVGMALHGGAGRQVDING
jgi:hypothetical protein